MVEERWRRPPSSPRTRPDGTVVTVLLDPSVPEQAQIIRDQAAGGDPNLRELTEHRAAGTQTGAHARRASGSRCRNAGPLVGAPGSAGGAAIGALDRPTMGQDSAGLPRACSATGRGAARGLPGGHAHRVHAEPASRRGGRCARDRGRTLAQRSAATMTAGGFGEPVQEHRARGVRGAVRAQLGRAPRRRSGPRSGRARTAP